MRGRSALSVAVPLALGLLLVAHVGTNDVFYAGEAGPWNVRVSIRQPGVIPGLADISVRVEQPGVDSVLVTARQTRGVPTEAPPPDRAAPVRGESGLFAAQLWLMVRGSHEVVVTVAGAAGEGVARIPIVAAATEQLAMTRALGLFVLGGGLFLLFGLLTIVRSASREGVLPAGEEPEPADRRRSWRATALATVVLALVLVGGWRWIDAESEFHRALLDRPWSAQASVRVTEGARFLDFEITDPLWVNRDDANWLNSNNRYRRADLVPDHGKLMHMFIVREPDLDAFAHIHPVRVDDSRFTAAFPPLPAGTFRIYADLTHEDGFSHTLVATAEAPASGGPGAADPDAMPAPDPDDAWWNAADELPDGTTIRWLNAGDPLVAGETTDLVFQIEDAAGSPVGLDPYMGMAGHAMLNRSDGEVFVHLHPTGMISMAAKASLDASAGAVTGASAQAVGSPDTVEGPSGTPDVRGSLPMPMPMPASTARMAGLDGAVRFPLVGPEPGSYRIWVQVRRGEAVLTGSFDAEIMPNPGN